MITWRRPGVFMSHRHAVLVLAWALWGVAIHPGLLARQTIQPSPVPVTFNKDIAPIIFDRCGTCHHPGGMAPFSLLTYAAAKQRASLIAAVTKSRTMPPWKAEPGYGEFIGQQPLT